jgi:AraC-like DNA-binding protein
VLLRDTELTLEVISSQVGLSSASALARAIKVHFGKTPQSLRQALRRDSDTGFGESLA